MIDCEEPSSLARFWAAALDDFDVRPYDDEEVARLAALGYTPETDPGVIVDGPCLEICFQKVDLEPRSKTPERHETWKREFVFASDPPKHSAERRGCEAQQGALAP